MTIKFEPIGVIRTPFKDLNDIPRQGAGRTKNCGQIEIFPEFQNGLKNVEEFSHLIVLFYFHRAKEHLLIMKPRDHNTPRGVFAIRSPRRPNPIGFTVVRLLEREGPVLNVSGVDMLDGTPVLDIKPYIADGDSHPEASRGWMGDK